MPYMFKQQQAFLSFFGAMFIKRLISYSNLFTFLVRWHIDAFSFPTSNVIFVELASPQMTIIFVCIGSK
jgi:hypothetical protein